MIERVAYLSMHTSPLLQPGSGDAGGMNVYIDQLSRTMAARGVEVDVFTRREDLDDAEVVDVVPGYRVIHVDAGPAHPLPLSSLPRYVRTFAKAVETRLRPDPPQILHSHYWLSGWAGLLVKRALRIPLANSFHTLGRGQGWQPAARRSSREPPAHRRRTRGDRRLGLRHGIDAGRGGRAARALRGRPQSAVHLTSRRGPPGVSARITAIGPTSFGPGAGTGDPLRGPHPAFEGSRSPARGVCSNRRTCIPKPRC